MKRINCYTYTRVSTAMQVDGYSLDAQREKLRRYAEFQNMQIAGEYTDEGKSGKNIEGRPEFCRMLEDIATGPEGISKSPASFVILPLDAVASAMLS